MLPDLIFVGNPFEVGSSVFRMRASMYRNPANTGGQNVKREEIKSN